MAKFRAERLQNVLKKELSDIIRNSLKDPRVGFVSVTDVEVSRDLRHVKAFISVFEDDPTQQAEMLSVLNAAADFVRGEVGKRVRLKHTPEIIFRLDKSIKEGFHINALLKQLEQDEPKPENG